MASQRAHGASMLSEEDEEPRLGVYRKSMESNVQLIKDRIGVARRSIFVLPPADHAYGIRSYSKNTAHERAKNVLTGWNNHTRNADQMKPKDYVAMNREMTINGVIGSKDVREYHKSHDVRIRNGRKNVFQKTEDYASKTFGQTYERTTPIAHLIANVYQHENIKKNELAMSQLKTKDGNRLKISLTKASKGHTKNTETADTGELWKMQKFKSVPPRIIDHW